jgi:protein DGCR14
MYFACVNHRPSMFSPSHTNRLTSLSPAAQKLATGKLHIGSASDKTLKASYTPSPAHPKTPGNTTPVIGVTSSPQGDRTLQRDRIPQGSSSQQHTPRLTPKRPGADSLTDNLLNLPFSVMPSKRRKASEFF